MRVVATFKYVKKDCGYYACNPCAMLCAPCKDRYSVELHCFDANGNNMGKRELSLCKKIHFSEQVLSNTTTTNVASDHFAAMMVQWTFTFKMRKRSLN